MYASESRYVYRWGVQHRARRRTARRRRAVVSLVFAVCIALIALTVAVDRTAPGSEEYVLAHVQPGDTLWDIALRFGDSGVDTRHLVFMIRKANSLDSSVIMPGDVLRVPVKSTTASR